MSSRYPGIFNATTATLLLVGIGAILVAPFAYFILSFLERFSETIGILSPGWGYTHHAVLVWVAGGIVAAAGLWVGAHYFRSALAVEKELRGDDRPPAG